MPIWTHTVGFCMMTTSQRLTVVVLQPLFSLEGPCGGERSVGWDLCKVQQLDNQICHSKFHSDDGINGSIEYQWIGINGLVSMTFPGFTVLCISLGCSIVNAIHQISDLESFVKAKVCFRGDESSYILLFFFFYMINN